MTRRIVRTLILSFVTAVFLLIGIACPKPDPEGPEPSEPEPAFAESSCGTCIKDACATAWSACGSDASCAAHLGCLNECPVGPSGDVDPECEATCPAASGSAGEDALKALNECRASGPGAECEACGRIPPATNPILNQVCAESPEQNLCWKCEDERCCNTYKACHEDAGCDSIATCAKDCANKLPNGSELTQCMDQCYTAQAASYPLFGERLGCLAHHCSKECGTPDDPCSLCYKTHCADEDLACGADLQCTLLSHCMLDCSTQSCFSACEAKFSAETVALHNEFIDCSLDHCFADCSGSS